MFLAEVNRQGKEPQYNPSQNGNLRKFLAKSDEENFVYGEHNLIY